EVKAEHDDFREVRFYKRGRHVEQFEFSDWFGLRRRKVETEVFDDIVLVVAMKTQAEIGSRRELRILRRRKIIPGSVRLKYFRNIACGDRTPPHFGRLLHCGISTPLMTATGLGRSLIPGLDSSSP